MRKKFLQSPHWFIQPEFTKSLLCARRHARRCLPMGNCTKQALPTGDYRLGMTTLKANVGPGERVCVQCPVTQWRQHGSPGQSQWVAKGNPEYETPVPSLQGLIVSRFSHGLYFLPLPLAWEWLGVEVGHNYYMAFMYHRRHETTWIHLFPTKSGQVLMCPVYRWGSRGSERWNDSHRQEEVEGWFLSPHFQSWCPSAFQGSLL